MSDINEITPLSKDEEKTLNMLKEKGMTFKGSSRAFSTFLILWLLSKNDMHGYKIIKKIDEIFKPQIEHELMKPTKPSVIYPLLKTMEKNTLIDSYEGLNSLKKVRIYRLTPEGKQILSIIKKDFKDNIKRSIWRELISDLGFQTIE